MNDAEGGVKSMTQWGAKKTRLNNPRGSFCPLLFSGPCAIFRLDKGGSWFCMNIGKEED
jgi:hypothetical protein